MTRVLLNIIRRTVVVFAVVVMTACSASKFIPEGMYMLDKVELEIDNKDVDVSLLEPYIRQKEN